MRKPLLLRTSPLLAGAALLTTLSSVSLADPIQQPDGTYIPQEPDRAGNPNERSLQEILDREEGAGVIDAETVVDRDVDAGTEPETFTPECTLTFEVLERGGNSNNTFGWYNVTGEANPPPTSRLYEIINCRDNVGTSHQVNFQEDPRWTGGEIAFYEASVPENENNSGNWGLNCPSVGNPSSYGSLFYTESRYNTAGTDPSGKEGYVYALIIDSKKDPKAFYFGLEDSPGGDWDFNDLLVRVSGIDCSGAGIPCETGLFGACAQGVTSCENGEVICRQLSHAGAESCNAIDDNCDGFVDEGDLCEAGYVCDAGVCRPHCGAGEMPCEEGDTVCDGDSGVCVEQECLFVSCEAGQRCIDGECKDGCSGVTCPFGEVCRLGHCADPCRDVVCDAGYICQSGACVIGCQCSNCEDGYHCDNPGSLQCIDDLCGDVHCPIGEHCVEGECIDNCAGVVCPEGEICEQGHCAPSSCTTEPEGEAIDTPEGSDSQSSTPPDDEDPSSSSGAGANATDPGEDIPSTSGCACNVPSAGTNVDPLGWLAAALAALAFFRRR